MGENILTNNVIVAVLLFFIQPTFIVGILYAIHNYRKRVNYTRKNFRVNFNREKFELKDFFLKGILPGVLLSILFFIIGMPLTIEWYILYQIITVVVLVVTGYRFIQPLFTFSLTTVAMFGLNYFDVQLPFGEWAQGIEQNIYTLNISSIQYDGLMTSTVLYFSVILFVTTFLMENKKEHKVYPVLNTSKRGKKVASYQKSSIWLLPLLIIVPGSVIEPFAAWWPMLSIGGSEYALLLLPVLTGFRFTVSTQLIEEAVTQLQKEFRLLAILGVVLAAASYFVSMLNYVNLLLLPLFGLVILIRHRRRENQWSFRYGPTNEGLRVIAVRRDSPAERLNLAIGDMILDLNDHHMVDKEIYNEVLANNRSYIKMRIRRKDGEIIIAETPLYDNDYNNLGLLILDN